MNFSFNIPKWETLGNARNTNHYRHLCYSIKDNSIHAGMAELADAADSKSAGLRPLVVRLPLPAPFNSNDAKGDLGITPRFHWLRHRLKVPLNAPDTHGESVDPIEDIWCQFLDLTNHFSLIADAPLVFVCESLHA